MTLEEKKEALIKTEWQAFQSVRNEGGRASCQDDPQTFFIMRRSQFHAWPEDLTDSYARDLRGAEAEGRNLLAEKYAWMMESTAPEQFERIADLLPARSEEKERLIRLIAEIQVRWMEEYASGYPALASGNRLIHTSEDTGAATSFETYLKGELHTYSEGTLLLYLEFIRGLEKEGKNLSLLVMGATVRAYGYKSLEEAEERVRCQRNV